MDKWLMFKNYMHNELGITKEDIRQWIQESVEEQAERMVKHEFDKFDVHKVVQKIITDDRFYGSQNLKHDIAQELTKQVLDRIKFE